MQKQLHSQLIQSEGRIVLAMLAIDCNQFKSVYYTAKTYNMVETTLR